MAETNSRSNDCNGVGRTALLQDALIRQIENALTEVGEYGEVRLIIVKGRLRFIQIVRSQQTEGLQRVK